jgi:hypothetical protein
MEEIKEILKTALSNKKAIDESLKASFNQLAINKGSAFIFVQSDEKGEILTAFRGPEDLEIDTENKREYLKSFLPNIDMIFMLKEVTEEETAEFFNMTEQILKQSFLKSEHHTICFSRTHKEFFGTSSEEWEKINISDFIDLENFIEAIEHII